jgi:hypothetical protein
LKICSTNINKKHRRKKLKKIAKDGKTSQVHGLEELVSRKWLYCQKQSRDSVQSPPKSQCHSLFTETTNSIPKFKWKHKRPE